MKPIPSSVRTVLPLLCLNLLTLHDASADSSAMEFLLVADPSTRPSYTESLWYPKVVQVTVGGYPRRANTFGRWPDYLIASKVKTEGAWHGNYETSTGMVLSRRGELLVVDDQGPKQVFRRVGSFVLDSLHNAERNRCRFEARFDADVEFDFAIAPVPFYSSYHTTLSLSVPARPVLYSLEGSLSAVETAPGFLLPWEAAAGCSKQNLLQWHMVGSRLP